MNIVDEYFWATECNLNTLHELLMLRTASKKMINRQKQVCVRMLRVCHSEFSNYIDDYMFPRIKKIMALNNDSRRFDESTLERWAQLIVAAWEPPAENCSLGNPDY